MMTMLCYKILCLLLALEVARMSCKVLGNKDENSESFATPTGHFAANDTYQTEQDPVKQANTLGESGLSVDDENVHDDTGKSNGTMVNATIPENSVSGDMNKTMTTLVKYTVEICKKYVSRSYQVDSYYRLDDENLKHMRPTNGALEMHISIKAVSDGYVILSPIPNPVERNDSVYEIGFGSGYNDNLNIRRSRLAQLVSYAYTPDILSATEFRSFYIRISKDGVIEVGKEGSKPYVRYSDPNPLNITYFGFSSWDEKEAVFLYDCPPGNNLDHELESHTKNQSNFNEKEPEATNYDEDYYEDVDNSENDSIVNNTTRDVTKQIGDEKNNITNIPDQEHIVNMTILDLKTLHEDKEINKTLLSTTSYPQHTNKVSGLASNETKGFMGDENNKTIAITVQHQHDELENATASKDTKQLVFEKLNKTVAISVTPQHALENATTSTKEIVDEELNKTVAFPATPHHETLENVTASKTTKQLVFEELNKTVAVSAQPQHDALENSTIYNNTKQFVFKELKKRVAFSVTPQHALENATTSTKEIVDEELNKTVAFPATPHHETLENVTASKNTKQLVFEELNNTVAVSIQPQHDALKNSTIYNNTKQLVFKELNKTVAFSVTPQHALENATTSIETKEIMSEEINKNALRTTGYAQHTNNENELASIETKDPMSDENNKTIAITVQHDVLEKATTSNENTEIAGEEVNKNVICCIDNTNHHTVKTPDLKPQKSCEGHGNKDIVKKDIGEQDNEVTIKISGAGKNGVVFAHFGLAIYGDQANIPGYIDPYGRQYGTYPYPYFGPDRHAYDRNAPQSISRQ